jgi:hypothetical protein
MSPPSSEFEFRSVVRKEIEHVHRSDLHMDVEGRCLLTVECGSMLARRSSFQLRSFSVKRWVLTWFKEVMKVVGCESVLFQAEPGKEPVSITPLMTRDEGEKWGRLKRTSRAMEGNDKCVGGVCECVWNAKNVWWECYLSGLWRDVFGDRRGYMRMIWEAGARWCALCPQAHYWRRSDHATPGSS